ncbi:hypothetical protein M0R45_005839 [Rubus argutus]|uniref:ABC transporter D family member 1 n=1 Tax=Rubus argutus TaxID=59490 RepID=A0AAW1YNY2_RUBAR
MHRKTLLLATGIVVAGGAAAYVQSRLTYKKHDSFGQYNGLNENKETEKAVTNDRKIKKPLQKRGGLKSLQVLAAILLSEMGQMGARDLLSLVVIVMLRTTLSNRLAKVQGFLFRAAFLRLHNRDLSLRFRKILTQRIHSHYFENIAYYKMSHVDGRITNPEQRIASDVPRFCSELSEIVQDDLTAVTDGLLYSWRLCSYASPKYIFWILAYVSLGTLASSSRKLNRLSGYADRIHELMVISRELSAVDDKSSGSRNCSSEADYIEFSGVKVVTPTGNVLVDKLSLRVEPGSNLLITGPNGSGKSSLFRVLGGLWPLVSGHIVKPGVGTDLNKEIFYVPQRPYTAVGTLRDQLIYPLTADQEVVPLTRDEMAELLRNVDLQYLLDRYPPEKEINWGDELSLGEQQRLGMARLFYHKPKFAILDECTSAVTTDMEERFCAKVRAMGTSCITISHRPALVAFHDVVLSLDGEGGWSVHEKREDSLVPNEGGRNKLKLSETNRQSDAMTVQRAFASTKKDSTISNSKSQSYIAEVIAVSPSAEHNVTIPVFPQLQRAPGALPLRVAAMFKVLIPTVIDKQGAQLLAVAFLVVSRTWISDRIASLNGTTVKFVLEQDKASFIHLIGVSVLQSAASSFIAPSLRHLTARLALGWRIRLTQHLLKNYLRNNAFYKVFNMSSKSIDADQRITQDLEKLTTDLSGLVTGMVKPSVDILWFTWRMKLLTGQRGVTILYAYMLLGLGLLRAATPEFGDLASRQQQLEGTFRFMHERLRAHAESVAFFGGGYREKAMVEAKFKELITHSSSLLKKKWLFALISTQGELAHALRFLASVYLGKALVTGPNGSGKSSVFRVLRATLHMLGNTQGSNYISSLFDEAEIRALKLYQDGDKFADSTNILDMRLRTILENVRLSYLLEREEGGWDANLNWEDTLSLGEQQRLGMARLFFHKPKFAILDECTNATSVDVEELLYQLAKDMGITVVTSSQRPALIPFHSLELRLIDGEGNWELRSIKQ